MKRIMFSKTLAFVLAFLVSPLSLAQNCITGQFLVGADIGYANRTGTLYSDYYTTAIRPGLFATVPAGTPLAYPQPKISDHGTIYGILGGYQWWYDTWFLGLEGNIDWGRIEKAKRYYFRATQPALTSVGFISEATYVQGARYGVTLRLGSKVPPFFMPYVKAGAEASEDNLMVSNLFTANSPLPSDYLSDKQWLWTWVVGAGVEVPFFTSDHSKIRVEYLFKPGSNFSVTDSAGNLGATQNVKLHTQQVKLGWIFNFH